jgi:signal transduction histidine kinase
MAPVRSKPPPLPSLVPIVLAFAVLTTGFVAASLYGEIRASSIDRDAQGIEENAIPSIEDLAKVMVALQELDVEVERYLDGTGGPQGAGAMRAAEERLQRELELELANPKYPGEVEADQSVRDAVRALAELVERVGGSVGDPPAQEGLVRELRGAVERTDVAVEQLVSANARGGHADVARIAAARRGAVRFLLGLNLGGVVLASAAAFFALRSLQRQRRIEVVHHALLEAQATELEHFAARAAHDLLAPLSALAFTLSTLRRNADKGLPLDEPLGRAWSSLRRSQALVNGIVDFARSGGQPSGEKVSLKRAVDGVFEEFPEESSETEIRVEGLDEDLAVACSPGVLASILNNLVGNAFKYMGGRGRAMRKLVLRATHLKGSVRVEVEDSGPGLPPGLEEHIFEPYVRAPDNPHPGLGLGLATVKRFVEAHGGRVGVEHAPVEGTIFWFEMPIAGPAGVSGR